MIERALTGGDDFEIICTMPMKKCADFSAAAAKAGVMVTEIGVVTKGSGAAVPSIGPARR